MMRFGQLEYEIRQCEQHLDAAAARNTEVENYLVRYLLVRICAEYETRIKTLVQRRCTRTNDPHLVNFASWGAEIAAKNFDIGDITGTLKKFGEDYKKAFSDAVTNQDCHRAWDSIYYNRVTVAHGNGMVMMTIDDLKIAYNDSLVVIDELVKALCLKPKDIKGLK
ncbi:MAG: hypothetical protein LC803_04785 [Acidobacteria bacterium]|nr:hypothetical protein [Acidobacteriota bacterium]